MKKSVRLESSKLKRCPAVVFGRQQYEGRRETIRRRDREKSTTRTLDFPLSSQVFIAAVVPTRRKAAFLLFCRTMRRAMQIMFETRLAFPKCFLSCSGKKRAKNTVRAFFLSVFWCLAKRCYRKKVTPAVFYCLGISSSKRRGEARRLFVADVPDASLHSVAAIYLTSSLG